MAVKEKALRRLADKLNAAGIPWGIGASWLLCQKGILDVYHDFDIFVAPEDAARADKVLSKMGMRSDVDESNGFHAAYHFDGADIDLNAGCVIDGKWTLRFDADAICEDVTVLGAAVHLMHLEDWLVFYRLVGRDSRADAVAAYLDAHGCAHPQRFAAAFDGELPEQVQSEIKKYLEDN